MAEFFVRNSRGCLTKPSGNRQATGFHEKDEDEF